MTTMPRYNKKCKFDSPYNCIEAFNGKVQGTRTRYNLGEYVFPGSHTGQSGANRDAFFAARPHLLTPGTSCYLGSGTSYRYEIWNGSIWVTQFPNGNPYKAQYEPLVTIWMYDNGGIMTPTLTGNFPGESNKYCLIGRRVWFYEAGYSAEILDVIEEHCNDGLVKYEVLVFGNIRPVPPSKQSQYSANHVDRRAYFNNTSWTTSGTSYYNWMNSTYPPYVYIGYCGPILGADATFILQCDAKVTAPVNMDITGFRFHMNVGTDEYWGVYYNDEYLIGTEKSAESNANNVAYIRNLRIAPQMNSVINQWGEYRLRAGVMTRSNLHAVCGVSDGRTPSGGYRDAMHISFQIQATFTAIDIRDAKGDIYDENAIIPGWGLWHSMNIIRVANENEY